MEKDELRPYVFEALRSKPLSSYSLVEQQLHDLAPKYNHQVDLLKCREILWELLIQGVLGPGIDSPNPNFPNIHVTEYGMRCLERNEILPHDPNAYLEGLGQRIGQQIDDIISTYVCESLSTFLGAYYLASAVMLGVASERCIDLLIEAYLNAIANASRKEGFKRKVNKAGRGIKVRFDTLRNELIALNLPTQLKDALDIQLSGIFTLIRYGRNDAGHPTGRKVDRDEAHGNLLLFPQYLKRVYELIDYFKSNQV